MGAGASATADPAALDVADVPLPEASEVARVVESVPADAQPAVGAALKRIGEIAKPAALARRRGRPRRSSASLGASRLEEGTSRFDPAICEAPLVGLVGAG